MTTSSSREAERRTWDRLDAALATLQACTTLDVLVERACELALTACQAQTAGFGWLADDGLWEAVHRAGDSSALDCHSAPDDTVIRCDGQPVAVMRIGGADADHLALACYTDGVAAMIELFALRHRADAQRGLLGRLRGTLGDAPDAEITLITELGWTNGRSFDRSRPPEGTNAARERLTDRQRDVLDLISAGLTNHEIAERLVIALPTVKSHVRAVLRAIGAVNRADAITRYAAADDGRRRHQGA